MPELLLGVSLDCYKNLQFTGVKNTNPQSWNVGERGYRICFFSTHSDAMCCALSADGSIAAAVEEAATVAPSGGRGEREEERTPPPLLHVPLLVHHLVERANHILRG